MRCFRRIPPFFRRATLAVAAVLCAVQPLAAQEGIAEVALPEGEKMELVWVEGGSFTMGCGTPKGVRHTYEAAKPEHVVAVRGFYIGRFEVTQAQWRAVMGTNPSNFTGSDSLPVEQITWEEAQNFVALLSQMTSLRFRLPTEAEWEYAARGGNLSQGRSYAGSDRNGFDTCGWYCVNSDGHTHPVGQLAPNELGLYDMSGNVSEWCADWLAPYGAYEQSDPKGPKEGDSRILRGGHYNSTSPACTVFDRGWYVPTGKTEYYGLRVVMEREE